MVPTDIRKIFILQIFGKPDFKNMWDLLLCIDMNKDGKFLEKIQLGIYMTGDILIYYGCQRKYVFWVGLWN